MPFFDISSSAMPCSAAQLRTSSVIFIGMLAFDAIKQATVQKIAHERTMQKIGRKTKFNLADRVQLRELASHSMTI